MPEGEWRNTARVLGPGLDTRASGGMVIVPPSPHRSGMPYQWAPGRSPADVPLAPLPIWIATALLRHHQRAPHREVGPIPALPLDRRIRAARSYLAKVPGAVQGSGGDHATFVAGAICRDFALEEREAFALMLAWNEKCSPPWSPEELEEKVHNAFAYATGVPGNRLAGGAR